MDDAVNDLESSQVNDGITDKEKCATSLEDFALTYFHHIFKSECCSFHHDMFKDAEGLIIRYDSDHNKFVRAAPRGHGKSRIISIVFPLWIICYNYRKNIMLIADTREQSMEYIQTIKAELEDNDKLREDFGDLVGKVKWATDEIITANDIHVVAKSSGQSLRGNSYKNVRPEVIILDDLENDESVETEGQRKKLFSWFMKVLMPIGSPRAVFLYVGSILHYESLLYTVLTKPEFNQWNRKIYKAVYTFSNSPLWQEWEKLYLNLEDEQASHTAKAFYNKHKKEMLDGVEVLWKAREPDMYYKLMLLKLQDDDAFNSEYQNNPMTEESRIIKEAWINDNFYEEPPEMKEIYAAVDLSMGKTRTADTSAIIVVGRGVDNYFYVLEADVERRPPDKIMNDMILYIDKYGAKLTGFIVETNVFQEFFATTIKDVCVKIGLYVNWLERASSSKDNKGMRIRSLAPKFKQGFIKLKKSQHELISQLKNFPKGHDDAPDALERCITEFIKSTTTVSFTSIDQKTITQLSSYDALMKGWKFR